MSKRVRKPRISETQQSIVADMEEGHVIIKSLVGDPMFSLDDGRTVSEPTFRALERLGIIRPRNGGLFQDSQSFELSDIGLSRETSGCRHSEYREDAEAMEKIRPIIERMVKARKKASDSGEVLVFDDATGWLSDDDQEFYYEAMGLIPELAALIEQDGK